MATLRATYGAEALPIPYAEALKNVHTLKDKVVVVTGGSKGIGKEYAVKAASYGAKVVVSARGQSGIDQVVQEITKAGGYVVLPLFFPPSCSGTLPSILLALTARRPTLQSSYRPRH